MNAYIDIENSKTKKVEQITVPLLEYNYEGIVKFDISSLSEYEMSILKDAIDEKLKYTDIEMFFTDIDKYPNFGPDYEFFISGNILRGTYTRNIWLEKEKIINEQKR